MNLDFDCLRIFVSVVENNGFNAAAIQLHKTQPAITASIKRLEDQLEFSLFDRSAYRPALTVEGKKLYHRVKPLLNHWQHISVYAEQLRTEVESDITIAIDGFFPLSTIHSLFNHWLNVYPLTQFHLLTESLGGACERLLQNRADFIISENLFTQQAVEMIVLRSEPMIAVATPHFIQQHEKELESPIDCMQVILRDSSKSNFSFGVFEPGRHWTVGDVLTKKELISASLGWGRLPKHLIAAELSDGRLQRLQGNHFDERLLTMGAIRLQKPVHGPVAEKIWQDLKNHVLVEIEAN